MRLDYKGKRWEKEMKKLHDYKKYCGEGYLKNVNAVINKFHKTENKDYAWLYGCLDANFQEISFIYLQENDSQKVIENTYLSARAMLIFKKMHEKGIKTQFANVNSKLSDLEYAVCKLIAVDCFETVSEDCQESIIGNIFTGNMNKAQKLVEQIPDGGSEKEDIYYRTPFFIKELYRAIIDRDEEKFNEELCLRVKKYRKNTVGYSTIIDYISIAFIKAAKKAEIVSNLHIIEVPDFFFGPINVNEVIKQELPFQTEINKLFLLQDK